MIRRFLVAVRRVISSGDSLSMMVAASNVSPPLPTARSLHPAAV